MITITMKNEEARLVVEAVKKLRNKEHHEAKWLKKGSRRRNSMEKKAKKLDNLIKNFGYFGI